jgi:hypothetical protein
VEEVRVKRGADVDNDHQLVTADIKLIPKNNGKDYTKNKRPMGHITHLSNLGPYENMICISFPFAPFDPRGPMILSTCLCSMSESFHVKIQLFLAS